MKGKIKKQKRKIILKITAVLLSVWLIVSVVFSIAVISIKKKENYNNEENTFYTLVRNINSGNSSEVDLHVDNIKQAYYYAESKDESEITCGADGYIDEDLQIVIYKKNEDNTYSEVLNTDKYIDCNGYVVISDKEHKSFISGKLVYDHFIESLTKEQLDSISNYLNTKKDKEGNYYELICKELYYNEEYEIIPKTIEITLTNEKNTWYVQDEVVESFKLNPANTDGLTLFTSALDNRNVIPGQFVLGTFKSGGLITTPKNEHSAPFYESSYKKVAPFTYIYKNSSNAHIKILLSEDIIHTLQGETANDNIYYYQVKQSDEVDMFISYAKRINLLDYCGDTLIFGNSIIFLFFLIIAVILIVMMCKVMKTQLIEEEKRSELTNALAHDIKTPLFIISGYAQNLKENVNTEKREHYCERIIDKTQEANDLVHRMLELSRIENLDQALIKEDINLKEMVNEIISSYKSLPNNKAFNINCSGNTTISADKNLMHRTISNLISNAVVYSDNESEINIDISSAAFSISNKCSNISQSDVKHLSEPYYRVEKNRNSKGNGLGLAIVKSIAQLHSYNLKIKLSDSIITFTISFA